jgi:type IV secretory pathway VirB2 component (pilin)
MKTHKINFNPLIVFLLIALAFLTVHENAYAISNTCTDMSGMIIPCPDTNHSKPGPKNRATQVVPSPTSIPTSAPASTPLPAAPLAIIPITGSGAGSNNSSSSLPAVQNPGQQGSSSLPGPLGMIIAILIIVVCFIGGLVILRFFRTAGENPAGFADGPVAMGDGSVRNANSANKFQKIEDPSSQFDKSSHQFLKLENDPSNQFQKSDDSANQFFKTEDGGPWP